eukprot:SAG31_NODE_543_length_14248_cov_3.230900_3_plen_279_part_00
MARCATSLEACCRFNGDLIALPHCVQESGLQFFADPADPGDFSKVRVPTITDVAATADGAVERLIEGSAAWGHGKRMYHASTRGFVIGGLVRQITGQTLGSFIATDIAVPLGLTGVHCGATLDEQAQHGYAAMQKCTTSWTLLREVLPAMGVPYLGESANPETWAMLKVIGGALIDKGKKAPVAGYSKAMPKEWAEDGGDHVRGKSLPRQHAWTWMMTGPFVFCFWYGSALISTPLRCVVWLQSRLLKGASWRFPPGGSKPMLALWPHLLASSPTVEL